MTELPVPGSAPFHLLTLGPFARDRVRCSLTSKRRQRHPEIDALIEQTWEQRTWSASERGQLLYPGPMCRFESWRVDVHGLHLTYGLTDYRELIGTNIEHPEIGARFGDEFLSNGSGICTVVETSDGYLIAHRRSGRVFEYPGMIDVCGGALEPLQTQNGHYIDPFASIITEIGEELGIGPDDIAEIVCLGVARDGRSLKPEILMHTRLTIASNSIPGLTSDEHSALFLIPGDPDSVSPWLTSNWEEITPASLACLVAHTACGFANGVAATWAS